jgi:tripartite-type tricarboxylate transporter receptor subunit TctC
MELLKMQAGVDIVHVPYPGSPQVNTAILADQIQAGFVVPGTAMPLVQSGRVKALAVTSSAKSPVLPELPTVAEAGFPGFESSAWIGMVAPARTPKAIIDRLNQELVAIINSTEVREKMLRIYFQAIGTSPEGLSSLMRSERDRWAKVIRQTGATAD